MSETRGKAWEAGRLAQLIRWCAVCREEYGYPPGMMLAATCCCHICVDDPNYSDGDVAYCIIQAAKCHNPLCLQLALLLASCSLTQRKKANHLAWRGQYPDVPAESWKFENGHYVGATENTAYGPVARDE